MFHSCHWHPGGASSSVLQGNQPGDAVPALPPAHADEPDSAEEYLRRVRYEAAQCPRVS